MGKFDDFVTTSCITSLTFLENIYESKKKLSNKLTVLFSILKKFSKRDDNLSNSAVSQHTSSSNLNKLKKLGVIHGIAKRSRSIQYTQSPRE